jgi:hypothetical protein
MFVVTTSWLAVEELRARPFPGTISWARRPWEAGRRRGAVGRTAGVCAGEAERLWGVEVGAEPASEPNMPKGFGMALAVTSLWSVGGVGM